MTDALPDGWVMATLGQLTKPSSAKMQPSELRGVPYLSLEHIESNTNQILGHGDSSDVRSTTSVFHSGDVLYGKLRPYLNKVAVPDFDGVCSTDILVLPKSPYLESRFLMWFLTQPSVVAFANHNSTGIQLPRISFDKLAALDVPCAPLTEQRRICDALDELVGRVSRSRTRLEAVLKAAAQFRQSVLSTACEGRLTENWRQSQPVSKHSEDPIARITESRRTAWLVTPRSRPKKTYKEAIEPSGELGVELPPSWAAATIDQVTTKITKGTSPNWQGFEYVRHGVPFVRSQNVRWGVLDLSDLVYLSPKFNETHQSSVIRQGDVLLNLVGASIGRAAVATAAIDGANCNQAVGLLRAVPDGLNRTYLLYCLLSPHTQSHIHTTKVDVARANFNLDDVRPTIIPVPPLDEQNEIVHRVEALLELAATIEMRCRSALTQLEELPASLLAKAFRGELVPTEAELAKSDNRSYERAASLLERIESARVHSSSIARGKNMAKNRAKRPTSSGVRKPLLEILQARRQRTTPEQLFTLAGFDAASVDAFYAELKALVRDGHVVEKRPNAKNVYLEVAGK